MCVVQFSFIKWRRFSILIRTVLSTFKSINLKVTYDLSISIYNIYFLSG